MKKKEDKKEASYKNAPVFDLGRRNDFLRKRIDKMISNTKYLAVANIATLLLLAVVSYIAFSSKTLFFATDSFGRFIPVRAYNQPHLTQERRMAHAEYIVRSLHSLSFINKDRVLSDLSVFFDTRVFKDYLTAQDRVGFFETMKRRNISYIASVEPGRIIANSGSQTRYSDPDCYEVVDGKKLECGQGNLTNSAVSSERYEFDVKRDVYVNGVYKGFQKIRVQIVLSKVNIAMYSQGYLVSEYTENLISKGD